MYRARQAPATGVDWMHKCASSLIINGALTRPVGGRGGHGYSPLHGPAGQATPSEQAELAAGTASRGHVAHGCTMQAYRVKGRLLICVVWLFLCVVWLFLCVSVRVRIVSALRQKNKSILKQLGGSFYALSRASLVHMHSRSTQNQYV